MINDTIFQLIIQENLGISQIYISMLKDINCIYINSDDSTLSKEELFEKIMKLDIIFNEKFYFLDENDEPYGQYTFLLTNSKELETIEDKKIYYLYKNKIGDSKNSSFDCHIIYNPKKVSYNNYNELLTMVSKKQKYTDDKFMNSVELYNQIEEVKNIINLKSSNIISMNCNCLEEYNYDFAA